MKFVFFLVRIIRKSSYISFLKLFLNDHIIYLSWILSESYFFILNIFKNNCIIYSNNANYKKIKWYFKKSKIHIFCLIFFFGRFPFKMCTYLEPYNHSIDNSLFIYLFGTNFLIENLHKVKYFNNWKVC